jgi:hypothetical protein
MSTLKDLMGVVWYGIESAKAMDKEMGDRLATCANVLGLLLDAELAVELAMELRPDDEILIEMHSDIARMVKKAHDRLQDARVLDDILHGRVKLEPDAPDCN